MRKNLFASAIGLMLATGAGHAAAQTADSSAGVSFNVSTLGYGVDFAVPVDDRINVRGGFSVFSFSHDFDNDGIDLAATLRLRSVSAYLDWFPFGGGFHVSPGVMFYNGNEVSAKASVPGGNRFSLGNDELLSNPANPVTGDMEVTFGRRVAPAVTVGWGNIVPRGSRRWSIPFELGVVFVGAPTASLTLNGSACTVNGANCRNIATDPTLQAALRSDENDLNDDIDVVRVYPILKLGFSYRF